MTESHKLSLFSAILININIMLGSGVFINTVLLSQQAGSLGALTYILVGILLFPLILGMSQLLKCNLPGGTFYHFGLAFSPFIGFTSSWSYFVAKLASFTLSIHVCISLLQQVIPLLSTINTLLLDAFTIVLFMILNTLNLKMGQSIQYAFIILKLIPLLFAILTGILLFSPTSFNTTTALWSGVPASVPFVLFAFIGFEASCSLSQSIKNSDKNAAKAILISYLAVVSIVVLYQLMFYGALGPKLTQLGSYLEAFPTLIQYFSSNIKTQHILISIMNIGIASSALGASYGMMFSNSWNLYTLAHHKHTFFPHILGTFNKHNIPMWCVITEGIIALLYLILSKGYQVSLQQVGAFGSIVAYTLSSFALLKIEYTQATHRSKIIPFLSIISCLILMSSFIWNIYFQGVSALLVFFFFLLFAGISMFFITKTKN